MRIFSELHRFHGVSDRRLGGGQVASFAPPPPVATPLQTRVRWNPRARIFSSHSITRDLLDRSQFGLFGVRNTQYALYEIRFSVCDFMSCFKDGDLRCSLMWYSESFSYICVHSSPDEVCWRVYDQVGFSLPIMDWLGHPTLYRPTGHARSPDQITWPDLRKSSEPRKKHGLNPLYFRS